MNHYISEFYKRGISVIPLSPREKTPDTLALKTGSWLPYQHTPNTEYELSRWFAIERNYGVVCGWENLTVLDFDDWATYNQWASWALRENNPLAQFAVDCAFRVATRRGVHLYLSMPLERNFKLPGLDVKTNGYVVGPGSIHPSGAVYEALTEEVCLPYVPRLADILPPEWIAAAPPENTELRLPAIHERDIWQAVNSGYNEGKDVIQIIREKFRIEDFFVNKRQSGGNGRWWMTFCPFHDDHNPSMWIDAQRGICQCHKCHNKPLDAINLYAELKGMSVQQAIQTLAKAL